MTVMSGVMDGPKPSEEPSCLLIKDPSTNANNNAEYELKESIGKGAFGNAFIAHHKRTGKKYVMKKVRLARQTERQRKASLQEMKIVSALRHPFIVGYKDSWIEKGHTVCIVSAFAEGGDLTNQLRRRCRDMKHFSETHLKEWAVQMLLALEYMHEQGVLHRDLKSSNVFLSIEGEVLIGDFGLAKVLEANEVAQSVVGTPNYMCPELLSDKPYGFKSDVWSLGCILYELTALRPAFQAFNVQGLINKIKKGAVPGLPPSYSRDWRALCLRCLTRDPAQRPSVKDLVASEFLKPYVDKYRAMVAQRMAQGAGGPPATQLPTSEDCISPPSSPPRNRPPSAPKPGGVGKARQGGRPNTAPNNKAGPPPRIGSAPSSPMGARGGRSAPRPGGAKDPRPPNPLGAHNAGIKIPGAGGSGGAAAGGRQPSPASPARRLGGSGAATAPNTARGGPPPLAPLGIYSLDPPAPSLPPVSPGTARTIETVSLDGDDLGDDPLSLPPRPPSRGSLAESMDAVGGGSDGGGGWGDRGAGGGGAFPGSPAPAPRGWGSNSSGGRSAGGGGVEDETDEAARGRPPSRLGWAEDEEEGGEGAQGGGGGFAATTPSGRGGGGRGGAEGVEGVAAEAAAGGGGGGGGGAQHAQHAESPPPPSPSTSGGEPSPSTGVNARGSLGGRGAGGDMGASAPDRAQSLESLLALCGALYRGGRIGELGTILQNFDPAVVPPRCETPLHDLSVGKDAPFQLGDKVMVGKQRRLEGTIRYFGPTAFAEGDWVGIELEVPEGKNNGVVQGVRYFPCRPNCGLFVRAAILRPDMGRK